MPNPDLLRLHWRPLIPGERDPELLWGGVLAAVAVIASIWLLLGLPTPLCPLHALTGLPCPTCGMTRAWGCLLRGDLPSAFLFNPLGMTVCLGIALYLLYASVVVVGRLPRLRVETHGKNGVLALRIAVLALVLANWIYLLLRERSIGP